MDGVVTGEEVLVGGGGGGEGGPPAGLVVVFPEESITKYKLYLSTTADK